MMGRLAADLEARSPPCEGTITVYYPKDFTTPAVAATAIAEGWEDVAQ